MKKNKQLILSTYIMLACTFFTSIAFANNDTLNKIANDNDAYFRTLKVQNNTRFYVEVTTTNSNISISCKRQIIYLRKGETKSIRYSIGMICYLTRIDATIKDVGGAASVTKITNYLSPTDTGDTQQDYIIEEIALDEQQTKFECRVVPRIL